MCHEQSVSGPGLCTRPARGHSIGIDCTPAPSRSRSTVLERGMGYGYGRCRGIPVVHLLEYLTIQIKPATPNLLALGVVHFGTCFTPLGLLRPRTLP